MIKLFLAGDVMLGRAIDQILRHPGDPRLFEGYLHSAEDYVRLAERAGGPIPRGVDLDYVWGDAGAVLVGAKAGYGIVNLETAVTDKGTPEPKGINYRMNPRNAAGLKRLGIDCCVLANNHVLDWGEVGLNQTLDTLRELPMATAGAGRNAVEAAAPAVLGGANGRVLVFSFAARDSGVPCHWSAQADRPGVNFIEAFDERNIRSIKAQVLDAKKSGDIVVASIHWGDNWGYEIPPAHISFAHRLIDEAMVDIVHGHSSHHPRRWEVYRGKLILYGCGDFLNDYEGISGREEYRGDLALMYLPVIDEAAGGFLASLDIVPFQITRFRLNRATLEDARWLCAMLNSRCRSSGTGMTVDLDGVLHLNPEWPR
jgi:poly-gamma-glutamate capsule biosynthesis protein CapA/YwtB (metallophosphatase superfamily)